MADWHRDFERAPTGRRWFKSLRGLWVLLNRESKALGPDCTWQWRALPHGAFVGLRHLEPARRQLRIARSEVEGGLTEKQKARWESEVRTFLKHFEIFALDGCEPCHRQGNEWWWKDAGDQPRAVLTELLRGEVRPGVAVCWDCLHETGEVYEIPHFVQGGPEGQRCNRHALLAGQR